MVDNNEQGRTIDRIGRRNFLKAASAAGITVGVAGCSGDGGDGGGGDGGDGGGGDGGDGGGGDGGDGGGGDGGDGLDTDNPVVIGIPATLSGAYATLGEFCVNGAEFAANEINNNGGINGREVQVVSRDNELDAESAISNARALVNEDGADFLTGVISSSIALAVAPVAADLEVPFLSTINGTDLLTGGECNQYTFRTNNNAPQGARAGMEHIINDLGYESIFFLGSDYAWPQSVLRESNTKLESMGLNPDDMIVQDQFVPTTAQDYSSAISNIANSDAEVVFAILAGTPGVRFLTQARDFGLLQDFHVTGTTLGQVDQLRPLGEDALGITSIGRWTYTAPEEGSRQFTQNYVAEHGRVPQVFTGAMYQGMYAMKAVAEEAGSTDPADTVPAWEGFEWEDPLEGTMTMRAEDHQALNPTWALEVVPESDYDGPIEDGIEAGVVPEVTRKFEASGITRTIEQTGCQM